jgi:hypothetical protein
MLRRRILERRLKEMLLELAEKNNIDLEDFVEWLYYAASIRAKASWSKVKRAVLSASELSARELAAYLAEQGVRIDEDAWIRIVSSGSTLFDSVPRMPNRGRQSEGSGKSRGTNT